MMTNTNITTNDGQTPTPAEPTKQKEIGGRQGPDPTRYGDWEKDGKCVDF